MLSQLIAKGIVGLGLLAHLDTSKYAEHLPLHLLEGILSRHGVELSYLTMSDSMAASATLLEPLDERMHQWVLMSRVIRTNNSTVLVQDADRGKT